MTTKYTNGFRGRYTDLSSAIYDDKFAIDPDTEVELIVKPPKGFEGVIPPHSHIVGGGGVGGSAPPDDDEEEIEIQAIPDPSSMNNVFARQLKLILKDNAIQRHAGNKRSGDLDMKHLYKAMTTGRCFSDKDVISKKCYSVALAVDCSGSMRDNNQCDLAADCAIQFIKHFQKLTQLSVILFNAKTEVVKLPNQIMDTIELGWLKGKILHKSRVENDGYGNHDHYAIIKSTEVLRSARGKKIIVVMADGQPACDRNKCRAKHRERECYPDDDNCITHTRFIVNKARETSHTVLGIGIKSEGVTHLYPDSEVVQNLNELYPSLIKLLQRTVKRGGGI